MIDKCTFYDVYEHKYDCEELATHFYLPSNYETNHHSIAWIARCDVHYYGTGDNLAYQEVPYDKYLMARILRS